MPRNRPPSPSVAMSDRKTWPKPEEVAVPVLCSSCSLTFSTSKGQMATEVKMPVAPPSATSVLIEGLPSSSTPNERLSERCTVIPTEFSASADDRAGNRPL
eukprot:scaffold129553_cov36-Tisochrysis_lutea.AAC.1